jgi:hypothetical protein
MILDQIRMEPVFSVMYGSKSNYLIFKWNVRHKHI